MHSTADSMNWRKTTKYENLAIYCHVEHLHLRFEVCLLYKALLKCQLTVSQESVVRFREVSVLAKLSRA